MIAFSINLPADVQAQIDSFASQYSVDSLVASAVAQVSSGGNQFNPNGSLVTTTFGVGVMGISKTIATALGFDATTQVGNIQAGIAYLAAILQGLNGNYALTLASYVTSTDTVETFNGIPPLAPVQNFVYNVSNIAALAGSSSVSSLKTLRNSATLDPNRHASKTGQLAAPPINTGDLVDKRARGQQNITNESSIEPVLQREDPTLSNTAWYADTGLVTGNPRIRASIQPVTFSVFLDRNDPNQMLRQTIDVNSQPIELQLNTSLSSFEITSKHVYNRTPSRTGQHITLWGMELDLISGSGSTGVFMNQFGLTDFMSTANINSDIKNLVTSGFRHVNPALFSAEEQTGTGALINFQQGVPTPNAPTDLDQQFNSIVGRLGLTKPSEAFRVAAQDAFVEFMKLFQMNGNIWFYSQDYANAKNGQTNNLGLIGQQEQVSPTAWSKKTGTSSIQQHARNNDVMTRGYVAMRYRNNIYLGYFKSLSWTEDADSPFQWKFNFTFQVEKTYTALYFSQPAVQFPNTLSQTLAITPPPPPPG